MFVSHKGAARMGIIENGKDRPYYNMVGYVRREMQHV
jgi:hypothetical protein